MAVRETLSLRIHGMHCASCVSTIEKGLALLDGVQSAQVNLATASAVVQFDRTRVSQERIIKAVSELGYAASVGQDDVLSANAAELSLARTQFLMSLLFSGPLMIVAMWPMLLGHHNEAIISPKWDAIFQAIMAVGALFVAGRSILSDALKQTRHLRANMNSLIAMGTLTAFLWSLYALTRIWGGRDEPLYFESAGMIVTLILLGRFLEARAKGKAGEAIGALMQLRPAKALAIFNSVEFEVDSATVRAGMVLRIRPGERIAADGVVVDGNPVIDESMLTGESMPVEKNSGATAIGGSLNGNTPFTMKVTAAGESSYLANVIRMVSEAQGNKAPVQQLADKVAGVFVPAVLAVALVTLVAWLILSPGNPMMVKSVIAVLIIACPCALGLATPTAVLAGTGRAARAGILIRGGNILEKLTGIDTVIFDKTGTLTYGEMTVAEMSFAAGVSRERSLGVLLALESQSDHPIARAIATYLRHGGVIPAALETIESKPGFGMTAIHEGSAVVLGNRALLESAAVDIAPLAAQAETEMKLGRAVVLLALDHKAVAVVSLADRPRDDARAVVANLKTRMKHVALLSGDNRVTAEEIGRQVGIGEINAGIRPEGKREVVESYRQRGLSVAMVGDGINDAPALAAADVGIAVSGGTDVAFEAADVVLLRPDLRLLTQTFTLARTSLRVIKQNLFWAFFYNVLMIPLAAGVFYPVTGWTLSPMLAAAAMACSSLFVVLNSLRLGRLRL